jgi:sec-independent protein translocase protein TatA
MERTDLVLAWGFSGWEILVVLVVALLLFGRRLPEIMRGLGSSVKEFKKGMDDTQHAVTATPPAAPVAPAATPAAPVAAAPPAAPAAPAAPMGAVARDMSSPSSAPKA